MKINKTAQSGSLESSDILIVINPSNKGRNIELESVVVKEYGESIKKDIEEVLDKFKIKDVHLVANDRGALTPTIKARTEAAINKALETES